MTPEGIVKRDIKRVLVEFGVWYYMPQPGPYQVAGIPDFIGITPWDGKFLGIEAKGPAGKATANQERVVAEINANGGVAIITNNAEEVRALLHASRKKAQEAGHSG